MTRVGVDLVHNLIGQTTKYRWIEDAPERLACRAARAPINSPEALLAVVRKIDAQSGI